MANACYDKDLLQYTGTAQAQRLLKALLPAYANVDERTAADLIRFTANYSRYLTYYNSQNQPSGTWEAFMVNDVAVTIAIVAGIRTASFIPFLNNVLLEVGEAGSDAEAKERLKPVFDFVFSLAVQLDEAHRGLSQDLRFATFLSVSIASQLALPLNLLSQYYSTFKGVLIDETSTTVHPAMPVSSVVFSQDFMLANLGDAWQLPVPFTPPAITLSGTVNEQAQRLVTHNLFTGPLQAFVNGVLQLVAKVPLYLEEVLHNDPSHEPHYALYLSFLRLFRFAQEHLNNFTQNHLHFYYHDVLRLANRAATPDFVHLVFELQKNRPAHLLHKGTQFKAGKNADGQELTYALSENLVVQKATVQSLKSIYLQKGATPALLASPDAASEDGQGAKLTAADGAWAPFGDPKKTTPVTIGFAVASNLLYLNEGNRFVMLSFGISNAADFLPDDFANAFTVQLTGKKGWITAETIYPFLYGTTLFLMVSLPGDAPPVVPYAPAIHDGNYATRLPVIRFLLKEDANYQKLKTLAIQSLALDVSATVKNLSLQNDDGKINPVKPFKPFGEFPESGASLIIGSKEVFQKPLTFLRLNFDWQKAPPAGTTGDASALREGGWSAVFDPSVPLAGTTWNLESPQNITVSEADFSANEEYSVAAVDGFLRLRFNSTAHSINTYLSQVQTAVSQSSVNLKKNSSGEVTGFTLNAPAIQLPPAPPVAKSVSVLYAARSVIPFNATSTSSETLQPAFYHLEPFGYRKMQTESAVGTLSLLPQFELDNGAPTGDGGELWIGLKDAAPAQTFSLLFQVSEGTANPLKESTMVRWYYLSGNNWMSFENLAVADGTNDLTRSGLVVISVPAAASLDHTRAESGLLWIKAVVDHNTDAVCKLVSIRTNAAKAVFVQDVNNGLQYTQQLPSNVISKAVVPEAAIKKTEQPFASFGGRVKETSEQFSSRVSERLRHKRRAIAIWDYERLVLQQFPQLHKAKCIPHTGFITSDITNSRKYSETLPGHVMVVTIPNLQQQSTVNPLRPYTSVGLLTEIQQYLQKLTSPFVRLHVVNPQFEEVQFEFEVSFHPHLDQVFYSNLLNTAIEQFLTPWAFQAETSILFGGKIEKSVVLNFVEEQSYVDYITCFKMHHIILREGATVQEARYNVEEAIATTARSILVSYSNEETGVRHLIHSPANCNCHD